MEDGTSVSVPWEEAEGWTRREGRVWSAFFLLECGEGWEQWGCRTQLSTAAKRERCSSPLLCLFSGTPHPTFPQKQSSSGGWLPAWPEGADSANSNRASEDPAHSLPLSVTGRGAGRS